MSEFLLRRYSWEASDGKKRAGFRVLNDYDPEVERFGREHLTPLTSEPEVVEYRGIEICRCPERHVDYAEGTVKIYVITGRVQYDWSGVKSPQFPCEKSDAKARGSEE